MNTKYNGKHTPADYEKIIPEYYCDVSNSGQMPGRDVLQALMKETFFDSILTETGKNFPEIKGLENDELWFELVAAVTESHVTKVSNGEGQTWDTIITDVVTRANFNDKVRSFKPGYVGYLAAALILLSVVSISIFVKMNQDKSDVTITSKIASKDIGVNVQGVKNDSDSRMLDTNRRFNIIDLDSGSRAFVDSGALVSGINIEDKRVSVNVLKGAVSFSVAKKKQRSFIVNAGLANIVVTGTKFRVIRMDNVVTVAVNNGSVNTMYNSGSGKTILADGQVAIVMKDTAVVITNDSMPDLPERKLLTNLLDAYVDVDEEHASISKRTADSLLDILFTSGLSFAAEGDLIEHFSCILESKGRFGDALTVLRHHPEYENKKTSNESLKKLRSALLLKTGDTTAAIRFIENTVNNQRNLIDRCDALRKLYTLYLKSHNVLRADTCFHQFVECTQKKEGLDKEIIDHAHLLRNALIIDAAQFWYEYLLENFAESKCRKDAEYWVSDCIVQKSIGKNSALYNKSTSSGR